MTLKFCKACNDYYGDSTADMTRDIDEMAQAEVTADCRHCKPR